MKIYAGEKEPLIINDASGKVYKDILEIDTDTGYYRTLAVTAFGDLVTDGERICEYSGFAPLPLDVWSPRLRCFLTSQSQLDYLRKSRQLAHVARRRHKNSLRRMHRDFDQIRFSSVRILGPIHFLSAPAVGGARGGSGNITICYS